MLSFYQINSKTTTQLYSFRAIESIKKTGGCMINTGSDISSSTSKKSDPEELLLSRHIQVLLISYK